MSDCEFYKYKTEFVDLTWQHDLIGSGVLVKLCEREMN